MKKLKLTLALMFITSALTIFLAGSIFGQTKGANSAFGELKFTTMGDNSDNRTN